MGLLSNRTSLFILLCSLILVSLMAVNGWADSKCYVCGLDLSDFANTRYTITTKDKETFEACSFYCAAMILKNHKPKKIQTVDFASGKKINAKRAIYVIDSAVKGAVHNKSWLTFGHKNTAKVFILRNCGMSRHFRDAIKAMSRELDNKADIPKLLKSKQTPGCLKCHAK